MTRFIKTRQLAAILMASVLLPLEPVANAAPLFSDTSGVHGLEEASTEFSYADIVTDPTVIDSRIERLRQSDALVMFLSAKLDDPDEGLRTIAMIATDEGIDSLIKNTAGMKFVVTSSDLGVALVPQGTRVRSPRDFPTCWRGWLAAYTYFAATGMVCGAFHVAGGVPGIICDGIFFTVGMLPDFNTPCKK